MNWPKPDMKPPSERSVSRCGPCLAQALSAALFGLVLTSCAGDMADLYQFVEKTKQNLQGTVPPLPEFEPYQNFVYDSAQLRDPFIAKSELQLEESDEGQVSGNGIAPNRARRKEPLESYPLDTLKMVGILAQSSVTWGLIQAPDGTIHRVLPGNYAGQNYGEITSITEEKIGIYEIIPDGQGAWMEREASLALGED